MCLIMLNGWLDKKYDPRGVYVDNDLKIKHNILQKYLNDSKESYP